jgi:hypothetical protein
MLLHIGRQAECSDMKAWFMQSKTMTSMSFNPADYYKLFSNRMAGNLHELLIFFENILRFLVNLLVI